MKRIILLTLLVVAGTMIIWSQVPQSMNYKAVAKDDWGVALPNKTITLRFTILQGSGTGSIVYQETHTTTTNKFGLMDVEIGKGTPVMFSFDMIDWSTGVYYIKIEMAPNGGTDFRLEDPAHQLLSVPYALFAESSGNTNFTETDPVFTSSPSSGIWSSDIFNWNTAFGWGNHANEGYLKSLTETDPVFQLHPARGIASDNINNWNNAYSWGNHAGLYKPLTWIPTWDEITVNPFLISSPLANQLLKYNAIVQKWENWSPDYLSTEVDGSVSNEIQSLSQVLDLGNDAEVKNIINLANPINAQDAATKAYVDALEARILALESAVNALISPTSDEDDDGYTVAEGDCNDNDASRYPGAIEICGDGIDQDCDGSDLACSYSNICFPLSTDPISTMVRLINNKRIQRALSPVAQDPRLILAAQKHAEFLVDTATLTHVGENKSTFWIRCANEGYTPAIGESIAAAGSDPNIPFNLWFNDSLPTVNHHDIMLLQNAKHLGVGYAGGYWVVDFGAATDGMTCSVIENDVDGDGYSVAEGDCIDNDPAINPGATELCDRKDNDCDGMVDEGCDLDQDGYATAAGDCNDNDASIYPSAPEICGDGKDQDCNGSDLACQLSIGDEYQGGKVAYILQIGDPGYVDGETHGIIAASSDQGSEIPWMPQNGNPIITSALGLGDYNTNQIVSYYGEEFYAAKVCSDLVLNSFDDWYLPSKDELNKLYLNRLAIGGFKTGEWDRYWSSTELDYREAWWQCFELDGFNSGIQNFSLKLNKYNVRAIRYF